MQYLYHTWKLLPVAVPLLLLLLQVATFCSMQDQVRCLM